MHEVVAVRVVSQPGVVAELVGPQRPFVLHATRADHHDAVAGDPGTAEHVRARRRARAVVDETHDLDPPGGVVDHRVELGLVVDHVESVACRTEGPGIARTLHPGAAHHVGREVGAAEMQRGRAEDLVGAAVGHRVGHVGMVGVRDPGLLHRVVRVVEQGIDLELDAVCRGRDRRRGTSLPVDLRERLGSRRTQVAVLPAGRGRTHRAPAAIARRRADARASPARASPRSAISSRSSRNAVPCAECCAAVASAPPFDPQPSSRAAPRARAARRGWRCDRATAAGAAARDPPRELQAMPAALTGSAAGRRWSRHRPDIPGTQPRCRGAGSWDRPAAATAPALPQHRCAHARARR